MQLKRVLITGGAGFIGTHLASFLLENRIAKDIISLDLAAPQRPVSGVDYRRHDVRLPFDPAFDEPVDAVFNLAAVHRTPGHQDFEYYETNIGGANQTVRYCERHDVPRLVFTSSISVYGPSETAIDETSQRHPNHAYGRSKWLAEEIQRAWLERAPTHRHLVIARPAVVFGQGENGNYTKLLSLMRRGVLVFPGRKDVHKAGGYVKELVQTFLFGLEHASPYYLYNFAEADCPSTEEICKILVEISDARPALGVIPLAPMLAGAVLFEGLERLGLQTGINRARVNKLTRSTYVVARRLIEDGYSFQYDLKSALADWIATDPSLKLRLKADWAPTVDGGQTYPV